MNFASQRAAFGGVDVAGTRAVKGTGPCAAGGGGTNCEMFGCVAREPPRAAQVICAKAGVAKRPAHKANAMERPIVKITLRPPFETLMRLLQRTGLCERSGGQAGDAEWRL